MPHGTLVCLRTTFPSRNLPMDNSKNFLIPANLHPYLEDIAKRLYSKHAAIMVGSGFSRNAVHPNSDHQKPPDWTDLGDMFYTALYGATSSPHSRYMAVPTLAHEVEAAIGRPALEQMLRGAIPDLEHEPTELHADLLSLPWVDVFTTNYDTLLERASRTLTTQRYDFVTNQEDLVVAERPRIIKLHGSFPSTVPFVITDEDYRSYPESFAPFLNTVRQCLLENTLCLIGFSGTDPNFLQWIGWLHDHIGRINSPRLYLIGVFNLSLSQIQLLERRNIVVVDMSLCEGIESGDHYSALTRFIEFLTSKRSQYEHWTWPLDNFDSKPRPETITVEELSETINTWKHHRQSYPGWVIAPEDQRKILRNSLHQVLSFWESPEALDLSELPVFVDLALAFELIWRTEKCLYPIFDPQAIFIQSALSRYWDADPDTELSEQSHYLSQQHKPTQSELKFKLHHMSLAVMRYYREEGMQDDWKVESERLATVKGALSPEHKAQYHYELALCALYELNPKKCQELIKEWEVDESLPFWEAKRAGLLVEVGRIDEAKSILNNSLKTIRIRSNLKPIGGDYSLISHEAHVMMLLQYVEVLIWQAGHTSNYHIDDNEARWSMLHQFKCDPKSDLMRFELILSQPNARRSEVSERPAFDIGQTNRTFYVQGPDFGLITAYTFLHFCEDAGIPLIFSREATKGVLSRIAAYAPHWAVVSLIRLGDRQTDVLDSIFSRYALSRFDATFIDTLVGQFLEALDVAKSDIAGAKNDLDHSFGIQIAQVVPAVLSRLCSKCSPHSRTSILDFLHYVYQSGTKARYSGIGLLTARLLNTLTIQERIEAIPRLLDFPVVSHPTHEYVNPLQFLNLAVEWITCTENPPSDKVAVWLANAASAESHVRQWAVITLATLHDWSLLSESQESTFAAALWDQRDSSGWPMNTGLHRFKVLELPCPAPHDPCDLFRRYVTETPFLEDDNPGTEGSYSWTVLHNIQNLRQQIPWSNEDIQTILCQCMDWWDKNKDIEDLTFSPQPFLFDETDFKRGVTILIEAMASVIQSSTNLDLHSDMKSKIQHLIHDFAERGVAANRFASVCLTLFPDQLHEVLMAIHIGLASSNIEAIVDSLQAVRTLLEITAASTDEEFRQELSDLLLTVGQIVFWRRGVGLPETIDVVAYAVAICPWIFSGKLEYLILGGLRQIAAESVIHIPSGRRQNMAVDESDFASKLEVRRNAAHLAFTLHKYYTKIEGVIPDIVSEWKAICHSDDEFAEIRNKWIEN